MDILIQTVYTAATSAITKLYVIIITVAVLLGLSLYLSIDSGFFDASYEDRKESVAFNYMFKDKTFPSSTSN